MFCTSCGKTLNEQDRFCASCGKPASGESSAASGGAAPNTGQSQPRLMRSMRDSKIAGVCSGFARYFGIDVTLVRILLLIAIICYGVGLGLYLIAWIVMPRDDQQAQAV